YQARQISMDRMVALKVIHAAIAEHPDAARRFDREMQATAKIEHANTIRVYDYGQTDDGQLYLAMEFLAGRTLTQALAESGARARRPVAGGADHAAPRQGAGGARADGGRGGRPAGGAAGGGGVGAGAAAGRHAGAGRGPPGGGGGDERRHGAAAAERRAHRP